ncbi:MAG: NAD-dependent epimerase/dehydratase family protein [Bacteroidota bacterium]
MKKVLLTGANGLLGGHIARQLLAKGYAVRAIVRPSANCQNLEGLAIEIFEGQITKEEDVFHAVKECAYIIHAAAKTSQWPSDLEAYRAANIDSTRYLIKAAREMAIQRFIFVSTAVCFQNETEELGNEENEIMSWLEDSGYVYSKYIAQQEVLRAARRGKLPAIVVSPAFIIGSHDSRRLKDSLLGYSKKRWAFLPSGGKSFIDAGHAAEAIVNALTRGKVGESYLLSGENLSYQAFFSQLDEGNRQVRMTVPDWLLIGLGKVNSFMEAKWGMTPRLSEVNARMLCLDNYFSNRKAQQELGLRPTVARDSAKAALTWFHDREKRT